MTDDLALHVTRKLLIMAPILQRGFGLRIQAREDDATMIQLRSLSLLSGGELTISELAQLRQVSLQTASETVRNLEARKWVQRVRNPKDRRQWIITLTHAGLQQLEGARNHAVSQMLPQLDQVTTEELEALDIALDALSRVFSIPHEATLNAEDAKDAS
jgi:DNA-binding MarR family transcriptional regulator